MSRKINSRIDRRPGGLRALACAWALFALASAALAADAQKTFASPEEAVAALVAAVKTSNLRELRAILGTRSDRLINSGDPTQDRENREKFVTIYNEASNIVAQGESKAVLEIGQDNWPMPIPLVKSSSGWFFDTKEGEAEILARRIGRNELTAIQVCHAIVDAQAEYAALDPDNDGNIDYAPKFLSTPGKHDGLFWAAGEGEQPSPIGPLVAAASKDAHSDSRDALPYHGYYFKMLSKQGRHARGGARNYFVKGEMIGGFAAVAYPARYGASGVKTFIVNHEGVVYEKDLGKDTAKIASRITAFDPDKSWKKGQ